MQRLWAMRLCIAAVAALAACSSSGESRAQPVLVDPGASKPEPVREAVAVVHPTRGSTVTGVVRFRESNKGLDVTATISGLPPGAHAYHVHVFGDCSAENADSAGPHFHFKGSAFDKGVKMITGNLGEVAATSAGTATHRSHQPDGSLQGRYSIVGRSVVIHAKPNDPSKTPDGGAGDRIACGVIGVAEVAK